MLGHIISKEGINIDPSRVEGILKINTPCSKKEVQSFPGKVNFLRRFIPNLVKIIKHITYILRKGNEIKWNPEDKKSFKDTKVALNKEISRRISSYSHSPPSIPLLVYCCKKMIKILKSLYLTSARR
jgi:hypothetical protein